MHVITPIINLNGDNPDRLIENLVRVHEAIDTVLTYLQQAAPNGRNYYPEPGLMEQAQTQHWRRMRALTNLQDELQEEWEGIARQK